MNITASPMPTQVKWHEVVLEGTTTHTIMVTGSREFEDLRQVHDVLSRYAEIHAQDYPDIPLVLVSGHAQRGADVLAEMIWPDYGPVLTEPAHWDVHTPGRCKCANDPTATYCRLAGIVRNEKMVNDYKPSVVVAFYEPTAANRGTNHAAEYARSKDIPVRTVIAQPKASLASNGAAVSDADTYNAIQDAKRPVDTTNPLDF